MKSLNDVHLPFCRGQTIREVRQEWWDALQQPQYQRQLVLVTVSIALLLDNMLYMVIVPIIPDYLRYINAWETHKIQNPTLSEHHLIKTFHNKTGDYRIESINKTSKINVNGILIEYEGEDSGIGLLFASKAAVQIFVNPISGAIIDRIGYDLPMMFGLTIMFFSTLLFACGKSYGMLFFARSLQGVGSAFADTGGLSMIADRYTEEAERSKALGIALAFISFGCLVAPPFGGILYQYFGKSVPFIILAFVCLIDGALLLLIMRPMKHKEAEDGKQHLTATPIWKLLIDPDIAIVAGALICANVSLAFLEPTISKWMNETMQAEEWQQGMIWLPAFFPHVAGVIITVKAARTYPQYQWLLAGIGLAMEGLACIAIPFCKNYFLLMLPICFICFGIALIDTALLPMLGFIVDKKYVAVYGSVYAIADISYCAAYAVGPIIAGHIVEKLGFTALNMCVAVISLLYAPALYKLRSMHDYNKYDADNENEMMAVPPAEGGQGYQMQLGPGQDENYSQVGQEETYMDDQQDYGYQNQQEAPAQDANPFRQPAGSNPFRK